jgi:arylsulfatase A
VKWTKGPELAWGHSGPLRGAKGATYEGGIRVPGILRWPGKVPAGRDNSAIVSTLDVLPTFAALAGVADEVPTDRIMDGVNQTELFLGNCDQGSRKNFRYYDGNELQAIRQGKWKLRLPNLQKFRKWTELDQGTQDVELYNLAADISEKNNVAKANPDLVKKMLATAEKWKSE